ncbi:MAG: ABC transporter substrate-binding protein [Desulfovibrio sp.]|nr:ABC transporter substrate-binding protein [Desulfovibrio sp.]
MKKVPLVLSFCVLFLFIQATSPSSFVLANEDEAPRIIPLYSAFSEILDALDAKTTIVAKTEADTLPGLETRPSVGTHMRPNIERIIALKPSLVLQLLGREEVSHLSRTLSKFGITVLEIPLSSFEDLWKATFLLGEVCHQKEKAEELVAQWKNQLESIAQKNHDKRIRVFYEIRERDLLAAGTNNIVNEIIQIAGGENVVTIPKKIVHLSDETVIGLDPDAYIIQKGPMNKNPKELKDRPNLTILRAARDNRVLYVDEKIFSHPGPHSIEACAILEQWLHQKK